jgi:hypothetical protein
MATSAPEDIPTETPPETTTTTEEAPTWMKGAGIGAMIVAVLGFLYLIAFHVGAAVLSYQKFGSILWAILDFFFPYFYYPYYAFALSNQPAAPAVTMGGARRVLRKMVSRRRTMGHKPWKTL